MSILILCLPGSHCRPQVFILVSIITKSRKIRQETQKAQNTAARFIAHSVQGGPKK